MRGVNSDYIETPTVDKVDEHHCRAQHATDR